MHENIKRKWQTIRRNNQCTNVKSVGNIFDYSLLPEAKRVKLPTTYNQVEA